MDHCAPTLLGYQYTFLVLIVSTAVPRNSPVSQWSFYCKTERFSYKLFAISCCLILVNWQIMYFESKTINFEPVVLEKSGQSGLFPLIPLVNVSYQSIQAVCLHADKCAIEAT